jgi:hypothetical protein
MLIYLPSLCDFIAKTKKKLNSMALVRKRTIPTERPPLVGEVSAKLLRVEGAKWSAQRIPTAVNLRFLDWIRYFFIQVAPQLSSRGRVYPVPDLLLLRKCDRPWNRTRGLWICSQKLCLNVASILVYGICKTLCQTVPELTLAFYIQSK